MLIKRLLLNDRGGAVILALILLMMIIVPILNLAVPTSSPLHLSTFSVTLLGKFLCYALLALSVDLIWGYCGILSLGQGAFFSIGGYAMGMYLMRQIGARGQYGNPELPDFMVFLNWDHLPWYWHGFEMFWFSMLMVIVLPGTLAFIFGWLTFRSRVTGVYFSIITQALTYALWLAFFRNEMGFGGNNGLTDFKDIVGYSITAEKTRIVLFLMSGLLLMLAYMACRYIVTSRFGRIVISIRDAESRTRFCGYKVESYKLWIFVFSSVLAGIAGALYVPQVGIINPGEFSPLNSIELVVWVATGGRGTLFGAIVGAFTVNYGKTIFTTYSPETWLFALGALFVIVTLVLPKGLVGLIGQDKKSESAHESLDDTIAKVSANNTATLDYAAEENTQ